MRSSFSKITNPEIKKSKLKNKTKLKTVANNKIKHPYTKRSSKRMKTIKKITRKQKMIKIYAQKN